jgi:predicted cupin superfamily sugar epimerase
LASTRVDALVTQLELSPHPEGGFYAEVWRSDESVVPEDGRDRRVGITSIYFLLPAGTVSRWHRVHSDEVWHHYEGASLELLAVPPGHGRLSRARLGPLGPGQAPVHTIPAGWWQAARSLGDYTLVGCSVGPGFEFADFDLLADDPAMADALVRDLPEAAPFR